MLLHNYIPHSHEDDFKQLQLKKSEVSCCLAFWFKSVLQLDFGEDHLEVFSQGEQDSNVKDIKVDSDNYTSTLNFNTESHFFVGSVKSDLDLNVIIKRVSVTHPDRAPPSNS